MLAIAVAAACAARPRALVAGEDSCDYCRMSISDTRFGGEVLTGKGRLHTFDSVECLVSYVAALGDSATGAEVYVADYESSAMVPAKTARFVVGGSLHSPMGQDLVAFAPTTPDDKLASYGGRVLTWDEVRTSLRSVSPGTGATDSAATSRGHSR